LRQSVFALALALVAAIGLSPATARAGSDAELKVVIIVGPVGGQTDSYKSAGNEAYYEALKYTSDVTRVYTPNATWSAVKAAAKGASIVVYLGHGNGWPSPYTYDPQYTTKDGFGLNPTAGSTSHKYYGEPYVASLDLAPNAVVILNRLCYASGNSEPGHPDPDTQTARWRVANYAAGFLAGNASAVLSEGHGSVTDYIRAIFTTDVSLVDAWRTGGANGNEFSFASTRTSGATAYMDPNQPGDGFYRSLVTRPGVTTTDVRNGAGASTSGGTTPFTDISSSMFKSHIVWLYQSGLTAGCSPTRFCPNDPITRGQMASFLSRALELPGATKDYFKDDNGKTHETDINKMAEAELTGGCGGSNYCPTAHITRAQMAAFLARALELPGASKDYFSDDNSNMLEAHINKMAEAGLTGGCGGSNYCPNSAVTRGQMAAFLHRAFGD